MPKTRALLPVLLLVAALASLSFGVGTAAAKKKLVPCWKRLQNDAYDQHIDGTYSIRCYNQAIRNIPGDSLIYGSLIDQLTRARDNAIADLARKGIKAKPGSPVPGEDSESRDLQSHKRHKGLLAAISDKIGPGNGSSIPLPLLVLAGLGLLLIAAAGASFLARWIAARRAQPQPATSPPTPRHK